MRRWFGLAFTLIVLSGCQADHPLSDEGPWLLMASIHGENTPNALWAVDADSDEAVSLISDTLIAGPRALQAGVSPTGGQVAFITSSDSYLHDLTLHLLTLPSGQIETIVPLTSSDSEPPAEATVINDPAFNPVYAIAGVEQSVAWSPDGKQLAFISAHEGSSADLYVYDINEATIQRLTNQPQQAMLPHWSPDGNHIIYMTYTAFDLVTGFEMDGVYVVDVENAMPTRLYDASGSLEELFTGWNSPDSFIVYSRDLACGWHHLRTVDITNGNTNSIWADYFNKMTIDPDQNITLISVDAFTAECNDAAQAGLFRANSQGAIQHISDIIPIHFSWDDVGLFYAVTLGNRVYAISPEGVIEKLPESVAFLPQLSPDNAYWAWAGQDPKFEGGLWLGLVDEPPDRIYEGALTAVTWTPDSKRLFFVGDNTLYRVDRTSPDQLMVIMEDVFLQDFRGLAWVMP